MANADWRTVEIETELSEAARGLYLAAKDQYKVYKAARDSFEQYMQTQHEDDLPEGAELKFGYKFGKLSLAIGPKIERKAKVAVGSLVDWLNAQQAQGRDC